ncbi:MAG: tRNA (adenosine(37)-N6)-threonylcarbamoyltransferase complex dimerization subunit type 1 TsaB [Spirochaetaceae bacterium]|nr:tRNA (adenosine(37)-N6)-threonylcarbamoyltransferase complex dimerization subunit type 1 TsaB [Spirochaetaceae bacterium]
MNVLALETSGRVLTVALKTNDQSLELTVDRGFKHGETIMPAVSLIVNLAGITPEDLNLVTCSAGPGSFTGLRIGMATAKGIARGADCHLKAVPTLPLLAAGREHWPGLVVPVMDARKNRVYTAAFRAGKRIRDDVDMALDEFLRSLPTDEQVLATGPDAGITAGFDRVTVDPLHAAGRGRAMIEAAVIALEAEGPDPPDLGPVYLRLSEAEEALEHTSE